MGFWFCQQAVPPQADGTLRPARGQVANHTDGDLLLLVNFTGGGLVPTIQVFKWQGGVNGGPVLVNDPNLLTGECGVTNPGNLDVCAITNSTASLAPATWHYVPKSGPAGTFPPQSFFQGGVNIHKIFRAGEGARLFSLPLADPASHDLRAPVTEFPP